MAAHRDTSDDVGPRPHDAHGAFDAMFRANYDDLFRFALRRVGAAAAADDVADVFLVAWRRRTELPRGEERLWLFGVARNVVANERRSADRRSRLQRRVAREPVVGPQEVDEPDDAIAVGALVRSRLDMLKKTSTARRLLHDADPAHAVPPPREPAVDEALQTVRRSAQHEAPDARMPAVLRPRHGRTIGFAVSAVIAVVALSVAVALVREAPAHRSGAGSSTGPSTAPSSRRSSPSARPSQTLRDPHFTLTVRRVEQILASVPTLPGSTRAEHPPVAALRGPSITPGDRNLVDRGRFWTAPGTMAAAIAYYEKNPPPGMVLSITGFTGNKNQARTEQDLAFEGPSTSSTSGPQLQLSVVAFRGGVAVRADAMAIWIPTKPAAEYLGSVSSVDVTVRRLGAAVTVRRTLRGAAAQRLARAVDAAPVDTPARRSCPMSRPGFSDELVFHAQGRTIHVVNQVTGCVGLTVTVNGAPQPPLSGSIDAQVTAALGLPSGYGQ